MLCQKFAHTDKIKGLSLVNSFFAHRQSYSDYKRIIFYVWISKNVTLRKGYPAFLGFRSIQLAIGFALNLANGLDRVPANATHLWTHTKPPPPSLLLYLTRPLPNRSVSKPVRHRTEPWAAGILFERNPI